jgi:membrane fusion protein
MEGALGHGLFRREVMDAQRGSWLGSIHVATPLSRWGITFVVGAFALALIGFLVFGHYTRRSRVVGQLVPSAGLISVQARMNGSVTRVLVHEGQHVRRGQSLLSISGDTDSEHHGELHVDIGRQLRSQQDQLKADLTTQNAASAEDVRELKHQLRLLRAQRGQIDDQRVLLMRRLRSDRDLLGRIQPLGKKGYVSAFQIQQQKGQLLQDQGQVQQLSQQRLTLEQKISDTQQKLAQVPLDLAIRSNATKRQLNEIAQRLAQNEAEHGVILRAPASGIVSTLLAQPGQAVQPGQSLLSVLPKGSTLQAQLLVPSRAVGFVEPGSRVVIRYQAYPYQKFGQQYGRVGEVSRSALSASEVLALTGRRTAQPLYRVRVTLNHQHILADGKTRALKPGMALNADILMDRRTLLEWAFEPLYGLGEHLHGGGGRHG